MDKLVKVLKKLSAKEKKGLQIILKKIKSDDFANLNLKKLKGKDNIFRVRKGKIRVIFMKRDGSISILAIERRSDNTYNI